MTRLLLATKELLEIMTSWSRNQVEGEEVSNVYVRFGYEYNMTCRSFKSAGIETTDLGNTPDVLRPLLEEMLSQDASAKALDEYLPQLRQIITFMLERLKKKQGELKSLTANPQKAVTIS